MQMCDCLFDMVIQIRAFVFAYCSLIQNCLAVAWVRYLKVVSLCKPREVMYLSCYEFREPNKRKTLWKCPLLHRSTQWVTCCPTHPGTPAQLEVRATVGGGRYSHRRPTATRPSVPFLSHYGRPPARTQPRQVKSGRLDIRTQVHFYALDFHSTVWIFLDLWHNYNGYDCWILWRWVLGSSSVCFDCCIVVSGTGWWWGGQRRRCSTCQLQHMSASLSCTIPHIH